MVEVDVLFVDGFFGMVVVFFGVSIGVYEVWEFCDGDKNIFMGKGVIKVIENINGLIVDVFIGMDLID